MNTVKDLTISLLLTISVAAAIGYSLGRFYAEKEIIHSDVSHALKEDNNNAYTSLINNIDLESPIKHPWLKSTDLIYNGKRNTVPIVNEEYNVVFFLMAKVASTDFVQFFARLQGNPNWCKSNESGIHRPEMHQLKFLNAFSLEEAQEIMTNPKWKKAIFVRHPKERLLSAFLDKAIHYSEEFVGSYCNSYKRWGGDYNQCVEKHERFDFFLKEITTTLNLDVHWRPIYSRIDEKWWPYIDYIGYMDTIGENAQNFLSSIHSKRDGVSAWDRIGTSGWKIENEEDCASNLKSEMSFFGKSNPTHSNHATSARDKMLTYYTPDLEVFVEEKYNDDLHNPFFHFDSIKLFPENGGDDDEEEENIIIE